MSEGQYCCITKVKLIEHNLTELFTNESIVLPRTTRDKFWFKPRAKEAIMPKPMQKKSINVAYRNWNIIVVSISHQKGYLVLYQSKDGHYLRAVFILTCFFNLLTHPVTCWLCLVRTSLSIKSIAFKYSMVIHYVLFKL